MTERKIMVRMIKSTPYGAEEVYDMEDNPSVVPIVGDQVIVPSHNRQIRREPDAPSYALIVKERYIYESLDSEGLTYIILVVEDSLDLPFTFAEMFG